MCETIKELRKEELYQEFKQDQRDFADPNKSICLECRNFVPVDDLTEESICTDCKPGLYCSKCGAYDKTIKFSVSGLCEVCEGFRTADIELETKRRL